VAKNPKDVELSNTARKFIDSAESKLKNLIKEAIKEIAFNPMIGIPLQGSLKGLRRVRVGDYRIVYQFTADKVEVVSIRHRKDVYR